MSLGGEDLIPPTRSLEGRVETLGRLTVVSEPPDLEVFLDGSEIGQTPVWHKEVKPGFHKLRVRDSERDIFVEPGKTTTVSYFKGSFIDVPREQGVVRQPRREPRKSTEGRKRTTSRKGEERGDTLTPFEWFLIFNADD
jgi:hypothetical protein